MGKTKTPIRDDVITEGGLSVGLINGNDQGLYELVERKHRHSSANPVAYAKAIVQIGEYFGIMLDFNSDFKWLSGDAVSVTTKLGSSTPLKKTILYRPTQEKTLKAELFEFPVFSDANKEWRNTKFQFVEQKLVDQHESEIEVTKASRDDTDCAKDRTIVVEVARVKFDDESEQEGWAKVEFRPLHRAKAANGPTHRAAKKQGRRITVGVLEEAAIESTVAFDPVHSNLGGHESKPKRFTFFLELANNRDEATATQPTGQASTTIPLKNTPTGAGEKGHENRGSIDVTQSEGSSALGEKRSLQAGVDEDGNVKKHRRETGNETAGLSAANSQDNKGDSLLPTSRNAVATVGSSSKEIQATDLPKGPTTAQVSVSGGAGPPKTEGKYLNLTPENQQKMRELDKLKLKKLEEYKLAKLKIELNAIDEQRENVLQGEKS